MKSITRFFTLGRPFVCGVPLGTSGFQFSLVKGLLVTALLLTVLGCGSEKARMVLAFSPENASVTVDGYRPTELKSPHTFDFYKSGTYRMEVSAPGYIPVTMMIVVQQGEVLNQEVHLVKQTEGREAETEEPVAHIAKDPVDEPQPATKPTATETADRTSMENQFVVRVSSEPSGATAVAQPAGGGAPVVAKTPGTMTLSSSVPWTLIVSLDGFEPLTRTLVAPQQGNDVDVHVTLTRRNSGKKPVSAQNLPQPLLQNGIIDRPVVVTEPRRKGGILSVNTTPWTTVSLDGVVIGNTPIVSYFVTPGAHRVLMENRDLSKRKVQVIEVHEGEHVRIAQEL